MMVKLLLILVTTVVADKPGVKMRLTSGGVSYGNRVAIVALTKLLNEFKLENIEGKDGKFSYRLSNFRTSNVEISNSQISLNPGQQGLTWSIRDFHIELHVDYWARYKVLFVPISNSGKVSARFGHVSLTVTAGIDQFEDGSPKLNARDCQANIGDFDFKFGGSLAWLLNLLKGLFRGKIHDVLNEKSFSILNKHVFFIPVEADIFKKFVIDYHLTAPLLFTDNFLESQHKGAVYWKDSRQDTIPFSPDVIPDRDDYSHMINIWMTEFPLKTLTYAAHMHDYLQYIISTDTMPEKHKTYLQTTCPNSICAGTVIPQIEQNYPNSLITIKIKSLQAPDVNLTTNGLGFNLQAGLELLVSRPDGAQESVVLANVTVSLVGSISVRDDLVVGHMTQFVTRIDSLQSKIGDIDSEAINSALVEGMNLIIIPGINEVANAGIPLPVIPDLRLRNSNIIYENKYLVVATDVQYQGID
ncbi:hypothetical protein Btru_053298 [Bulinus truncatus]|nr:hypothetical protein Btru_053298 [Bulinus truncatus]